jgi:hypothetical protein
MEKLRFSEEKSEKIVGIRVPPLLYLYEINSFLKEEKYGSSKKET